MNPHVGSYVLLIDDEPSLRKDWTDRLKRLTLFEVVAFGDTIQAGNYIYNTAHPIASFVDMKIQGDLEGPERLYNWLASAGKAQNFYFMTMHLSMHDENVKDRTGVPVLEGKHLEDMVRILLEIRQKAGLPVPSAQETASF